MQDYLERCVYSALGQTHRNLQIILVDDGSTDQSANICERLKTEHSNVEVIHRENGGLSAARNTGLDHVRGKWIVFLDADDYLSCFFVEQNLNACLETGADLVVCRFISDFDGNTDENKFIKDLKTETITGREAAIRHFGKDAIWMNTAWGKLSRISLWNNLRFPENRINEDVFVSHQLFYESKKVVISESYLYAYYQSPESIMRKPFTVKRLDVVDAWREGVIFFEKTGDRELFDIARRVYCNRLFDAHGICKKLLPDDRETHIKLRNKAVDIYREIRTIRSYADLSPVKFITYRLKQFIGRYFPSAYAALFLRSRLYI